MVRYALALGLLLHSTSALAQSPSHPRVASVRSLQTDSPAVLIDARSAWVNTLPEGALALCTASRCAPIARWESCAAPRCPGAGVLVHASEDIADVGEFPRGFEGFTAECNALRSVPELLALMGYQNAHPNPPGPPLDFVLRYDDSSFELGFDGGYVGSFDRPIAGAMTSVTLGIRDQLDTDGFDAAYIGNQVSMDVALHIWLSPAASANGVDVQMVLFGFRPSLANTLDYTPLRVPTVVSPLIPEVGLVFRPGADRVDFYIAFGLEASLRVTGDLGIRLRASGTMTFNTDDLNQVEGLGLVSAGLFLPVALPD